MPPTAPPSRTPYVAAAVVGLAVLTLYLLTLAPTTAMWDAGEYMAAAYGLGLPHPPGNPLFVLLGRFFSIIPIAPTVAQRINVLAALSSAVAAALWFLIAYRVLGAWIAGRWQRIAGASLAAAIGATAFTVWHQSVVNEKVYTVALAGLALISWLTVRWLDKPEGRGADRTLILIAYLLGLGYANHMAGMLAAPAVAIAVLSRQPRILLRWQLVALAALAMVLGLTPFITQPVRAAMHPMMNTGEPTGCVDGLAVDCTLSATTLERFRSNANREQYPKISIANRQAPIVAQAGMYWLYFRWQWLGGPQGNATLQQIVALVFLGLGLAGGYAHWRYHRQSFWYFGPLMLTLTLGLIYYLNFKLGYSQALLMDLPFDGRTTEVRDRDYFYLWSFSAWGVWAALGLTWIWRALAGGAEMESSGNARAVNRRWLLAAPVLLIALLPFATNARTASRAGDTFTRDWAVDMLNSVEPYGIIITNGDNDTFPLWYAQDVEGVRRDVTVAVTSLLGTDWYVRQIIRRPIHEYDAARGPAIYRDTAWPKPSAPPLRMTIGEADSVPQYVFLPGPQQFRHDSILVTIEGTVEPGVAQPYLTRDQLIVLRFIRDSFPERALYFSGGGYAHDLGLGDYIVRQGLVDRLLPVKAAGLSGVVALQGVGLIDAERTIALWTDVYTAPESLLAHGRWVDVASEGIPRHYAGTGLVAAEMLAHRGDESGATKAMDVVRRIVEVISPGGA